MMTLTEKIEQLDTKPLNQEEEYEYSSKFLEWFYANMYRQSAFKTYPVLHSVSEDPEYRIMSNLCVMLINIQYAKCLTDQTREQIYGDMKQWLLTTIKKYSHEDVSIC